VENENSPVEYKDFRTGYTFKDIRRMLQIEARRKYARGVYMFITRHTVLGRWHEIKQQMYQLELDCYESEK
jgi:DNA primase catalytic subunit